MILLSLLFLALSALREPTGLAWVGYSGDGACSDMALGAYCTCDHVKVAEASRCIMLDDMFDDASCIDGVMTVWESPRFLWTRTGFACLPHEYANLTNLEEPRPDLYNLIRG